MHAVLCELRGLLRLSARDEDFFEEEGPTAGQSPGTSASSTLILVSNQCPVLVRSIDLLLADVNQVSTALT